MPGTLGRICLPTQGVRQSNSLLARKNRPMEGLFRPAACRVGWRPGSRAHIAHGAPNGPTATVALPEPPGGVSKVDVYKMVRLRKGCIARAAPGRYSVERLPGHGGGESHLTARQWPIKCGIRDGRRTGGGDRRLFLRRLPGQYARIGRIAQLVRAHP